MKASANPMAAISTMRWSMSSVHGPQYSALSGSVPCARPATHRSQCVERPAAGDQRHDAPERSRVPLQFGDARREVRAEGAEARPGTAGRQVTDERFDEVDDRAAARRPW